MLFLIIIAAIILLYLFLICPSFRKHNDCGMFRGSYIAHRGLHNKDKGIAENSISAYGEAIKRTLPIEIDIRLSREGEVVVFHDDDLTRVCGVDKRVIDLSLKELRELRLSGTEDTIPTFRELLELVDGSVPLLIEIKTVGKRNRELCEKAWEILKDYKGKYAVQSFYPQIVRWFKKHAPKVCRGQLATNFVKAETHTPLEVIAGVLMFNFLGRPDFVSYEYKYPCSFPLMVCRGLGATTIAWTYTSEEQIDKTQKYFSAYIFENFEP